MQSWKPEVCASRDGSFSTNALAFATKEEAHEYAKDLFGRWTLCTAYRAVESDEQVTHTYLGGVLGVAAEAPARM